MTTKQIAAAAGVSTSTAHRKIKEMFPGKVVKGVATTLSKTEAVEVLRAIRKLNMVGELPQSAQQTDEAGRLNRLEGLVEKLVGAVAALVPAFQGAPRAPTALPAPPDLEPRDALRKLVDGYARSQGGGPAYHAAWSELYREFGYRYHRDIARAAKNRGQSVLDYADAEDIIGQLYLLAAQLYGRKDGAA